MKIVWIVLILLVVNCKKVRKNHGRKQKGVVKTGGVVDKKRTKKSIKMRISDEQWKVEQQKIEKIRKQEDAIRMKKRMEDRSKLKLVLDQLIAIKNVQDRFKKHKLTTKDHKKDNKKNTKKDDKKQKKDVPKQKNSDKQKKLKKVSVQKEDKKENKKENNKDNKKEGKKKEKSKKKEDKENKKMNKKKGWFGDAVDWLFGSDDQQEVPAVKSAEEDQAALRQGVDQHIRDNCGGNEKLLKVLKDVKGTADGEGKPITVQMLADEFVKVNEKEVIDVKNILQKALNAKGVGEASMGQAITDAFAGKKNGLTLITTIIETQTALKTNDLVPEFKNQLEIVGKTVDTMVEKAKETISNEEIEMKEYITHILGLIEHDDDNPKTLEQTVIFVMGQIDAGSDAYEKNKEELTPKIEAKIKEIGKYIKQHDGDNMGTEDEIVEKIQSMTEEKKIPQGKVVNVLMNAGYNAGKNLDQTVQGVNAAIKDNLTDVDAGTTAFLGAIQMGCDKVTGMAGGYKQGFQEQFGSKTTSQKEGGQVNIVQIFSHKLGKLTGHNKAELTEGIEQAAVKKGKKGSELVALLNTYSEKIDSKIEVVLVAIDSASGDKDDKVDTLSKFVVDSIMEGDDALKTMIEKQTEEKENTLKEMIENVGKLGETEPDDQYEAIKEAANNDSSNVMEVDIVLQNTSELMEIEKQEVYKRLWEQFMKKEDDKEKISKKIVNNVKQGVKHVLDILQDLEPPENADQLADKIVLKTKLQKPVVEKKLNDQIEIQKPDMDYVIQSIKDACKETGLTTLNIIDAVMQVEKLQISDAEGICEHMIKICNQGPDKIEEIINMAKTDNEQGGLTGMINGLTESLTGQDADTANQRVNNFVMMPIFTPQMAQSKILQADNMQNRARPWDMRYPIVQTSVKTGVKPQPSKTDGRKLKKVNKVQQKNNH